MCNIFYSYLKIKLEFKCYLIQLILTHYVTIVQNNWNLKYMSVINTNIPVLSRNKTISILSLKNNFMLNEINVRITEKLKKN